MISVFNRVATADTNAAVVKAAGGRVAGVIVAATTACTLHLYDKASTPTVGTDAPKLTFRLPVGTTVVDLSVMDRQGIEFGLGISLGAVKGATMVANDTTVLAAADAKFTIFYR